MGPATSSKHPAAMAIAVIAIHLCAATAYAQDDTAWGLLRENISKIDSISEGIALAFFTIVFLWFDMARFPWLAPLALVPVLILAVGIPRVRSSRLVRFGLVTILLGWTPLLLAGVLGEDNALGAGFLFAFAMPIGFLAVVTGTVAATFAALMRRDG
jgi:hypothetical protein